MKGYILITEDGSRCGPFMTRHDAEACVLALANCGITSTITTLEVS